MSNPVIEFCRTRQALKDEKSRLKESLEETADAKRVHMDLLRESMVRHSLPCLSLPTREGTQYARLVPGPVKYPRFETVDDVARHCADLQSHIKDVPQTDVPSHVLRIFLDRARLPDERPLRLVVQAAVPKRAAVAAAATPPPGEVARLSRTLDATLTEYRACRETVKRLAANVREASKVVENVVAEERPVVLEMNRNGARRVVCVSKEAVGGAKPPSARCGVREVSRIVRECARHAAHDRADFDRRFAQRLEELMRSRADACGAPARRPRIKVRERRVDRSPASSAPANESEARVILLTEDGAER